MAIVLKVRKVGNSLGVLLPKEVTDSMNIAEGDNLFAIDRRRGRGAHATRSLDLARVRVERVERARERGRVELRAHGDGGGHDVGVQPALPEDATGGEVELRLNELYRMTGHVGGQKALPLDKVGRRRWIGE